jgi:thiol-disulfide isomerase/thioredoxin
MKRNRFLFGLAISLSTVAAAFAQKPLDIGDPAPVLRPSKWLKGTPVPRFEPGKVYVVEFWATWCKACIEGMPHLSELARKYAGKAEVIGVDAFEPAELGKVAAFVKKQGARMDYRVAADGPGDKTWASWLTAAGETGIPVAFIVGKDGRVAWIGPPSDLNATLPKAIAGTVDFAAERAHRAATRDPRNAVLVAMGARDYGKAISLIDAEVARRPGNGDFCPIERYIALAHQGVAALRKRVRADLQRSRESFDTYNWLTVALLSPDLPAEAYAFGSEIAEEAATKSDRRLLFLARGAEMAMKAGAGARAVDLQTKAIAAAEATPTCTPERLAELREELRKYQGAKG